MSLKPIIIIFSWALLLELFSLGYFIISGIKTIEFYMDIALVAFTAFVLILSILKEKKKISGK